MKSSTALVASALAFAQLAAADIVGVGQAIQFFSTQNTSLVFAPEASGAGSELALTLPGDGSGSDLTTLYPQNGAGTETHIVYGSWCISATGVNPGTMNPALYMANCDGLDQGQWWYLQETDTTTISNAAGNCISAGVAEEGFVITLAPCTEVSLPLQLWNPKRAPIP